MDKRRRLALATAMSAGMMLHSPGAQAALESARSFLETFLGNLGAGQFEQAQADLNEVRRICPDFRGFGLSGNRGILSGQLEVILEAAAEGDQAAATIIGNVSTMVHEADWVIYLCTPEKRETSDGSGLPVGSAA